VVTRTKNKHLALLLSIMLLSVAMICGTVSADVRDMYEEFQGGGSITDRITPGGGQADAAEILATIEEQVSSGVAALRVIATIFSVVFIIWIGIIFFTSGGNPARLVTAKTQILLLFIALFCIFAAEPIVRFILSWFI